MPRCSPTTTPSWLPYAPFATAVEAAQAKQELVYLKRMQAEGRPQDVIDIQLVRQVRAIRAATADPAVLKTLDGLARADRLIDALPSLLERGRTAWAATMAKAEAQRPPHDSYMHLRGCGWASTF